MRITGTVAAKLALYLLEVAALAFVSWLGIKDAEANGTLIAVSAALVGVLGPLPSIVTTLSDARSILSLEFTLDVEETLAPLLVSLEQAAAIPVTELGVTAFIRHRTMRHPWHGVQTRVARIRLTPTPRPTTVTWTRAKGLLGKCWRDLSKDVERDHRRFYNQYRNATPDEWRNLPPDVTEGLSYTDFQQIRDYEYVLASPIRDGGSYKGCLVVQTAAKYRTSLNQGPALDVIHHAANTIAALKR